MKSSITVDLKVRGIGGSKFGVWVLGRVAAFFKIKLEVVKDENA